VIGLMPSPSSDFVAATVLAVIFGAGMLIFDYFRQRERNGSTVDSLASPPLDGFDGAEP